MIVYEVGDFGHVALILAKSWLSDGATERAVAAVVLSESIDTISVRRAHCSWSRTLIERACRWDVQMCWQCWTLLGLMRSCEIGRVDADREGNAQQRSNAFSVK